MATITITFPDLLVGKIDVDFYARQNARGEITAYCAELEFNEMGLYKTITSKESGVTRGKVEHALKIWANTYQKHLDKEHKESRAEEAAYLNEEAREKFYALENILAHTLDIDDSVDWDTIKRKDSFKIKPAKIFKDGVPPKFIEFSETGEPTLFNKIQQAPRHPKPSFELIKHHYGIFSILFRSKKIKEDLDNAITKWQENENTKKENAERENAERENVFNQAVATYTSKKKKFDDEKKRDNDTVEDFKTRYSQKDAQAIEEYCNLVLDNSEYPDYFPQNWQIEYREESRILVVEYDLLSPDEMPAVESYKYNKSKDSITEKRISDAALKRLYENVIYQVCIRTIHELLEADAVNMLDIVAFNGLVTNINPATGKEETKIIMSIQADKEEFMNLDLSKIDPKATFKHMKGLAATTLIDLTPIPPTIRIEKTDKRFIEGQDVIEGLDSSVNLAIMNWGDFEHLIRELFEQEFASNGGEVKVTQASADGGVDAIAFDPDPIRGGKIVIQAKRYTNLVGVSAVRDLYGTVMNEGATKGILVTTSDYGKDSHMFCKDKPLTLINGNNLLSLLAKHGHKARINIKEAKKILNE